MMNLPIRLRITRRRLHDKWVDLLAVLAGDCNDRPVKTGLPDEGNGYAHWRCALRRGHDGLHRYRNYVWNHSGRCEYDPVDTCPSPRREVHGAPTRRQIRAKKEWLRQQEQKRAAARRERRERA